MNKLYSFILLLMLALCVMAQAPQSFNYQAVVRDAAGQAITNQSVGIQISLLQTSAVGSAVYVEQFTVETNDYGLVNLDIGTGVVQSGVFADIEWDADKYFVKVELDEAGGTTYVEVGTSQLLSVPYALHSSTADELSIGDTWLKNGSKLYFNDGNVGIGIDDPLQKLHIRGNESYLGTDIITDPNDRPSLLLTGAFPNIIMGSNGNTNHGSTLGFWNFDGDATTYQWNMGGGQDGNFSIGFTTNSSNPHCGVDGFTETCADVLTPILINPLGFVGINKINPGSELDVNGDFSVTGKMNLSGSNQFGTLFFAESTLPHTGAHESILVLQNASDDPNSEANIQFASGSPAHGRANISATHDISAGLYNGNLNLEVRNGTTSYIKGLTIRSSGNVGIGNENPSVKLDVNGDVNVEGSMEIDGSIEGIQYVGIHSNGPDLTASGIKTYGTVGVNATGISAALYMASDGSYKEANADNVTTMPCMALAIEAGTGEKDILLQGFIRNDTWTFTIGAPVYVSTAAGGLTQTMPSTTGHQVQVVGYATASNIIYFSPDFTLIELN